MADAATTLNPGVGGDTVDTEAVTYLTPPLDRRRQRVQIAGAAALEVAKVTDAPPNDTDYGLAVRVVPDPGSSFVGVEQKNALVPVEYDYVGMTYDAQGRLTTSVYRFGGAGGAVVATVTLTYVGSSENPSSVART